MSLRWKILIFVCGISGAFAVTAVVVQHTVMQPGFEAVERSEASDDLARCGQALQRDAKHLSVCAADYAAWDATYSFVESGDPNYPRENFLPETFRNLFVNLIAVVASDGRLVWGEVRDETADERIDATDLFAGLCRPDHPLVAHSKPDGEVSGIWLTPLGPLLVGSRAVTTSDESGAPRGAVLMGRFLNDQAVTDLADRMRVNLRFTPLTGLDPHERRVWETREDATATWIVADSANEIHGYALINDIFEKPAILMRADMPRTISQRGRAAANIAAATALGTGAALTLVMWFVLSRLIVERLARLTAHAVRIGTQDDLQARLNLQSRDEVGLLAREFDRMVDRLEESRAQMLEVARHAGMAQVATEVLHNVGNVLNSVNVSAGLVNEALRRSETPTLGLAARLLSDHQPQLATFLTQDERGRQLPGFLTQLAETLTGEQAAMQKEMQALSDAIEHIRRIVEMQQVHSKCGSLLEAVELEELVAQARSLSVESFDRHHIQISTRFEPLAPIVIDRHKTLQILVNLLRNAKAALIESQQTDRCVEIDVTRGTSESGDVVRIRVIDNGVGIAPENLEKIFAFGFSLRSQGHGFGLHSAANMAREMGGSLRGASDGPGRGAVFTLELPLVAAEVSV